MRLIGDTHGMFSAYFEKIKQSDCSIQLGDFGLAKAWYKLVRNRIDPERHKIIPGNHDDYGGGIREEYTFGKDYGDVSWNNFNFFFVRGAWSIDHEYRTIGIDWWEEEELSYKELKKAIDLYELQKPEIMLSHDGPGKITSKIVGGYYKKDYIRNYIARNYIRSRTGDALREMFGLHKPKLWIFSHWHHNTFETVYGTLFVILDELSDIDYNTEISVEKNIELIKKQMRKKRKKLRF